MCGLSGEMRFDGHPADVEAVGRMAEAMHDRGPDGSGLWSRGPMAFGHRRLKIIDLSDRAAQPMTDDDLGLTIVFNGCLYNHHELRERLRDEGYHFTSTSDTEVLLKAYHRWGPDCVDHFTGMFAFAVAEHSTGRLVLGRDRLGIKPLYVSHQGPRLRFASTLPALLAAGDVDTGIDPVALHHYMTFHSLVPGERTILAGVRKLPPATVRTIEPDGVTTDHRYWDPSHTRDAVPGYDGLTADEWREAVLDALRTSVRRRMVSDVPVGVLLSGGLDSSLIVALLAEEGPAAPPTFSIGFESAGGQDGDEFHYSGLVARHFGTDHHQIGIPAERLLDALPDTVRAMSEPMVSHDCVAFHLLTQEVARHVKVVQTGQGADEVFAGYHWFPPLAEVPKRAAADVYAREFFDRPHDELAAILSPDRLLGHDASGDFVRAHLARPGAETALDAVLRLETTAMLVDDPVKRVDNMTMAHGLEARTPYLDHELVELAAACPAELKLEHGGKGVLKDAARKLLPAEIIDRPKGYFPVPAVRHVDGPVFTLLRDALTGEAARARGLFRRDYVDRILADPGRDRATTGVNMLWQLGLLELWLQTHRI